MVHLPNTEKNKYKKRSTNTVRHDGIFSRKHIIDIDGPNMVKANTTKVL